MKKPLFEMDFAELEKRITSRLGEDMHIQTAAEMFDIPVEEVTDEQRRIAKAENFRKLYGG